MEGTTIVIQVFKELSQDVRLLSLVSKDESDQYGNPYHSEPPY